MKLVVPLFLLGCGSCCYTMEQNQQLVVSVQAQAMPTICTRHAPSRMVEFLFTKPGRIDHFTVSATSLSASFTRITDEQFSELFTKTNPETLVDVDISWCPYLSERSYLVLARCSHLKKLHMNGMPLVSQEGYYTITDEVLLRILRANPELNELGLSTSSAITPMCLKQIVRELPGLKKLYACGTCVDRELAACLKAINPRLDILYE